MHDLAPDVVEALQIAKHLKALGVCPAEQSRYAE
jgi:hypothetical protein